MNDLRTAAQQALEALEADCGGRCNAEYNPCWQREVAETLRAVLAQQAEPVDTDCHTQGICQRSGYGITQQAEPVAGNTLLKAFLAAAKEAGVTHIRQAEAPLRAALAQQAEGGGNLPPPLQVPPEVAATLTTTDIAWLETRRLTQLWQELGQMRWAGADEGWDRAIEAVRSRLNDECQAVLDWKAAVDKSNVTAIELLQKMQGLKNE